MRDINIRGGRNTLNITAPTQRELELETISAGVTVKFRPKEKAYLEKLAKKRNEPLSSMIRRIVIKHLSIEPRLQDIYNLLDKALS